MLRMGTSGLLKPPHVYGQEGVHSIEDSVPQWEWKQRETSVRKPKIAPSLFLYKSPASGTVGGIVLMSNSQPNSRQMKKTLPTHCQPAMCIEFLLQMTRGTLISHLILSIRVLDSKSLFFLLFSCLVGINAYEIDQNKLVKYLHWSYSFEPVNMFQITKFINPVGL